MLEQWPGKKFEMGQARTSAHNAGVLNPWPMGWIQLKVMSSGPWCIPRDRKFGGGGGKQ